MDACGHGRITDFDFSQNTVSEVLMEVSRSGRWVAQEVLAGNGTSSIEADVFSFAMVIIEVCCN